MKKAFLTLALLFVFAIGSQVAAQPVGTPEKVIQDFYSWYLKAYNNDEFVLTSQPAKMKRYVTLRFYNEVKKTYDKGELDADEFICGQDADKQWASNIRILKITKTKSSANATVFFKGESFNHKLKVTLLMQNRAWKIDKVIDLVN